MGKPSSTRRGFDSLPSKSNRRSASSVKLPGPTCVVPVGHPRLLPDATLERYAVSVVLLS